MSSSIKASNIHISQVKGGKKVVQLTELAKAIKESLDEAGLKKWQVDLHAYLGIDAVIKAGFDATLRT